VHLDADDEADVGDAATWVIRDSKGSAAARPFVAISVTALSALLGHARHEHVARRDPAALALAVDDDGAPVPQPTPAGELYVTPRVVAF
jgi:hypothetical protein